MMNLLLDTHIFLWSMLEPERLSRKVAAELIKEENQVWFSPISSWEIMILAKKRRIVLEPDAASWLREAFKLMPVKEARINHEVAIQSCLIILPHQDPADRFLAATAVIYDLTLVTADERLMCSRKYKVLRNR
jgi:PIN domain nuclease of toxin-antitoxin system